MKTNIQRMITDIEAEVKYTSSSIGKNRLDPRVMKAMAAVPRHKFVPPEIQYAAYDNQAMPIGHGQTISQPYIVALMTDMLVLDADATVLEIGTGSGYQSAVLSHLCERVYTIEVIAELSEAATGLFKKMGYDNIETRIGNGYHGWPEHAPYDGIIVTAAATHLPQPLIEQLKPGGRMAIPIGLPYCYQELMLVKKNDQGKVNVSDVLGVAFVPLQEELDSTASNPSGK